jgi:hypothetical protein
LTLDLRRLANDPAAFRASLLIDADGGPSRFRPDDWQRRDFEALDPAWLRATGRPASGGHNRAWLTRPRGHSKTSDLAMMSLWALAFSTRPVTGVAAAADEAQAGLIRNAIGRIVRLNPWLQEAIDVQSSRVVNRRTGSELSIISSDVASSWGLLADWIVVDELTVWPDRGRELWHSLLSTAAKRENCLLAVISNAGWLDSWQVKAREACKAAGWYEHRLPGPAASWITPARLAEQRKLLPAGVYARLWLNEDVSGSGGNAIDEADLQAALTLAGGCLEPLPGWVHVSGLDLGISHDAAALVTVAKEVGGRERIPPERSGSIRGPAIDPDRHVQPVDVTAPVQPASLSRRVMDDLNLWDDDAPAGWGGRDDRPEPLEPEPEFRHVGGSGRVRLAAVRIWRPEPGRPVSISQVEYYAREVHGRVRLASLAVDVWQSAYLSERLTAAGVPVLPITFSPQALREMAAAVLEVFRERRIDLYRDEGLLQDLQALRVVEKQYGVRLESPRTARGHGDAATALSLSLLAARRFSACGPPHVEGQLLCY